MLCSARWRACLPACSRLTTLNASAVSAAERWDAEVNYLRLVTDELAGAGADGAAAAAADGAAAGPGGSAAAARAAVLAAHPRFAALTQVRWAGVSQGVNWTPCAAEYFRCNPGCGCGCLQLLFCIMVPSCSLLLALLLPWCCLLPLLQKYGKLTPAAPKAATGSALASSMAAVTICHGAKRLEKKLPGGAGWSCFWHAVLLPLLLHHTAAAPGLGETDIPLTCPGWEDGTMGWHDKG